MREYLYGAVLELVKLSQVALMIFGKLEQEYADGMLCDVTEKAINDWWTEIGSEYYNIEPTDGILGPTTVAALLGMLMGARNRLNYLSAPVAKDAFDVFSLKRGIAYFQKQQKMERTRRLDRHTLNQLHKLTAKAAAGEGWAVPKAVKSTVAELSGKGGEMVMGMVGRDKAGIGDIETLDLDRFISLVHGERAKWLWYGKRRRGATNLDARPSEDSANYTFAKDDHGGYMWSHHRADSISADEDSELRRRDKESPSDFYGQAPDSATSVVESPMERDPQLRKTVFRSVTGKMSDAKSGLGRIKDAVGRRGHVSRHSKDDGAYLENRADIIPTITTNVAASTGDLPSPQGITKSFTWKNTPAEYQNGQLGVKDSLSRVVSSTGGRDSESPPSDSRSALAAENGSREGTPKDAEAEARWAAQVKNIRHSLVISEPSAPASAYGEGDLEGPLLEAEREPHNHEILLRRRNSLATYSPSSEQDRHDAWWPRRMSFSYAEEAILDWVPISTDARDDSDLMTALLRQKAITESYKQIFEKISELRGRVGPWVDQQIEGIDALDDQAARDQEGIQSLYFQLSESYQAVKQSSQDVLGDERAHVTETIKDIELLGARLEYEINELVSKVQDVEDGVSQFGRQVDDLEGRATELETQLNTESWAHWAVRSITGIGTGPNITRPRRQ